MVLVKMQIAEGVDEFAGAKTAHLRDHHREQRVGRDVERHAEKKIGAALVKLAAELAVLDVELKKHVTRRQRHLLPISAGIPGAHDQAAARPDSF